MPANETLDAVPAMARESLGALPTAGPPREEIQMRIRRALSVLLVLAFSIPATAKKQKQKLPPAAPAIVETPWYVAPRPAGDGWLVVGRDNNDVVLVRDGSGEPGAGPEDSWSAQVLVMPPLSDGTPKGLTTMLEREYRDRLLAGGRFELLEWKAQSDPDRAATCVRYRLATIDREAYMGGSASGELMLIEEGLACEVAQPENGAVIAKMSWRGAKPTSSESLATRFDTWRSAIEITGAAKRANDLKQGAATPP